MKDIKDIMFEMENLSEQQMAAELSEEEKDALKSLINVDPPCTPQPSCPSCSLNIPYCCSVTVPNDFDISIIANKSEHFEARLAYVSCLHCIVDINNPCMVTVNPTNDPNCAGSATVNLYPKKIVGCIEFIVSAFPVQGGCGQRLTNINPQIITPTTPNTTDKSAAICCKDSLCVNNIVGYTGSISPCPPPSAVPCEAIKSSFRVDVTDCNANNSKQIVFSGVFQLPNNFC